MYITLHANDVCVGMVHGVILYATYVHLTCMSRTWSVKPIILCTTLNMDKMRISVFVCQKSHVQHVQHPCHRLCITTRAFPQGIRIRLTA